MNINYITVEDIDHSRTMARSSQSNGICEKFNRTIQNEFCQVAFRKKVYNTIEELQKDIDEWLAEYNEEQNPYRQVLLRKDPDAHLQRLAPFSEGEDVRRDLTD